jgi:hypothetical protein
MTVGLTVVTPSVFAVNVSVVEPAVYAFDAIEPTFGNRMLPPPGPNQRSPVSVMKFTTPRTSLAAYSIWSDQRFEIRVAAVREVTDAI